MFEAFLTNTSIQGLSPLGTPPQRSFELISETVRAEFGDRHAAVFAEPVATQYGDRFDWYAAAEGKPRALTDLDEDRRASVQQDLDTMLSDILGFGQSLLASSNPDQQRLGEALANAIRYPGDDCVYVLGEGDDLQPVLLNWAWISQTQSAVTGDLSGAQNAARAQKKAAAAKAAQIAHVAATAPPPPPEYVPPPPARAKRYSLWWLMWFGWVLLLLLIAAILYLMIESCALRLPGLPNYCPLPGPQASDGERRTLLLRDRIATLEREIAIADRACQPDRALAPIPDPNDRSALKPDADKSRLAKRGAREGQLTISLLWDSIADLHMDVLCPQKQVINYGNRNACGGTLDIGGNHTKKTAVPDAIESMYFSAPSKGTYAVSITVYNPHGQSPSQPFRLRIKEGSEIKTLQGTVTKGQPAWKTTFEFGKGS